MKQVTVNRNELIRILEDNKAKHRAVVERAWAKYRELVIEELDKRLDDAKNGRKINLYIDLIQPQDHTKDYERVILMLGMHRGENVEIDEASFSAYVQDEWRWKDQFVTSNSFYTHVE